jgi:putative oxidoreductase
MRKAARIGLWICQAALAILFVLAGTAKFASPMWPRMFARWGYPDHVYLIVGAIEVLAGLALLVPRLTAVAAAALIVVMLGAAATHLLHGENPAATLVLLLVLAVAAYGRWSDAIWRTPARSPA